MNKLLPYFLSPLVFSVAIVTATPCQMALSLSATEVSTKAEAITVRIDSQSAGSGVLIKRQGNTYTVLTAAHVVATDDQYELVTPDNQKHSVSYSQIKKLPNIDLALVEFTSSKSYQVAELGDSSEVKAGEEIYVSGFPLPTAAITEALWNFSTGEVTANAKRPLAEGYGLVYSNNTLPGMSGGAVLDDQGKLIGIHGRADAEQQVRRTETVFVKTGFNLGIPINTFLALAGKVNPSLGFAAQATAPTGSELTADDWFLQATDKYKKGNRRGSIRDFTKAIALNPEYGKAYDSRGRAYYFLKDYSKALADFNKAMKLKHTGHTHAFRGLTYAALNQDRKALPDFDKAIEVSPEEAGFYAARGFVYFTLGNKTKAKQDLQTAAKLFRQQNVPQGVELVNKVLKRM